MIGGVSGTSFATGWSRLKPEPRHLTRSGATPVQCRYVAQDDMIGVLGLGGGDADYFAMASDRAATNPCYLPSAR
jgi:hypothetical protein